MIKNGTQISLCAIVVVDPVLSAQLRQLFKDIIGHGMHASIHP
jgi:hypothetical protein